MDHPSFISIQESSSINIPAAKPSSINIPAAKPSSINIPAAKPSFIEISAVRPFAMNIAKREPDSISISPRECEVLRLIAHELTSKEIADRLYISCHTAISHRKHLMEKLCVKNTAGLVRRGFELGYLSLPTHQ